MGPFTDNTLQDKVITTVLVVLILLSASVAVYLYKYYHENEKYTEFYLLGPEKSISNYPGRFFVDQEKMVFLGLNNHEYSHEEYTVYIFLDYMVGTTLTVEDISGLHLQPNVIYEYGLNTSHEEEFLTECTFNISFPGKYDIHFILFKDGREYRELILRTQVFNGPDLISYDRGNVIMYITGPDGVPSSIPERISTDETLKVEIGMINNYNTSINLNFSISSGYSWIWYPINSTSGEARVGAGIGSYLDMRFGQGDKAVIPLNVTIDHGVWSIDYSINRVNWNFTITKDLIVR